MKNYKKTIQLAKDTTLTHRKNITICIATFVGVIAVFIVLAWWVNSNITKIAYQPASACGLFTVNKAKQLLGSRALLSTSTDPVQSKNTAVSKCGYTDGSPDTTSMVVAAVIIRSGINDKGVKQNIDEFAAGKPASGIEPVKDIGESAYFNKSTGQLNVLNGKKWIIVSFGKGETPQANTIADAVYLASLLIK